jgi:hypothetical protein
VTLDDYDVPESACWHCGKELSGAANVNETGHPEPGAVSLCLYCGMVSFFDEELYLRKPMEVELDDLKDNDKFRKAFVQFSWARQYVALHHSFMTDEEPE